MDLENIHLSISEDELSICFTGDMNCSALTRRVSEAFFAAISLQPKLPQWLLELKGMSGRKYRRFVNHLVGNTPRASYLEVGCWAGSTACSALFGNQVRATCIDNWSQFGGPKNEFLINIEKVLTPKIDFRLIESDFRKLDFFTLGEPFTIYMFDGPHTYQDQFDGVSITQPALADEFVLIIDDWNWPNVRRGTFDAIECEKIKLLFSIEIKSTQSNRLPTIVRQISDWHNGYFFGVCKKHKQNN